MTPPNDSAPGQSLTAPTDLKVAIAARAAPIVAALMEIERRTAARMAPLFAAYMVRLREAGLPITRGSLHIQQLHPQFTARSLI